MPLFYCACLEFVDYGEHVGGVTEADDFVVGAAYVDWAQAFGHCFAVD